MMKPPASPDRILVIMLRRIGDVVLTLPAVRALKKLYPQARIDFLTEPPCHELLQDNPDLHRVLVYDKPAGCAGAISGYLSWLGRVRQERYDWVIDYMGNPRSAMLTALSGASVRAGPARVGHRWAYSHPLIQSHEACYGALEKIQLLRSLGLDPDTSDFMPVLKTPQDSKLWAKESIQKIFGNDASPILGLIPASRKTTRRWPANAYAELGKMLRDRHNAKILVFWGPGEQSLAEPISRGIGDHASITPKTRTLMDLAALLETCKLVVTNCNGPKHIAVALQVPTLTLHGSSDPACWNPPEDPRHRVSRLDELFCIGCRDNECKYNLECMNGLQAQRVARQAFEMLENNSVVAKSRS